MKIFLALLIGAAIGIGAYIFLKAPPSDHPKLERTEDRVSEKAGEIKTKVKDTVSDIDTDQIRDELKRTGKVIRNKAAQAGTAISDATADARITTAIKTRMTLESDLSAFKISVNTTDGVVTLSGTVSSAEAIQKAMNLALAVDGVTQVISTLQVKE